MGSNGDEQNADCFANENMCLEPWQTFYAKFNGKVAPCVITNRNLGDLNTQGALEIWNGPEYQKFRSRMRSENKPYECLKALDNVEEYEAL